jgi:preprotein translocase subunit YajC
MMIELAEGIGGAGGGFLGSILPLVLMFAIFYFLLIRPQQKRGKQRNAMLAAVKKGDKVVTIGGIHATVLEIRDDILTVRISENTKVQLDRSAINQVTSSEPEDK